MIELRGLTWGHRRGIGPLVATVEPYRQRRPDVLVDWQVRTLQQFEHQSLAEIAQHHDLIVFDHPFAGEVAASNAFTPLGGEDRYIGPSWASYQWARRQWAVPVDGATMHALVRTDLLDPMQRQAPLNWPEVLELGAQARHHGKWLALALGGHHGLLALGSLMGNLGAGWACDLGRSLRIDIDACRLAVDALQRAFALALPASLHWNAVAVHDAMVCRDDIVYCPAAYGYATYGEADQRARLGFAPFPGLHAPFEAGTLIGGAGVGLSSWCRHPDVARAYLDYLAEPQTQSTLFASHHGQPACAAAWQDAAIDHRFNGFFSATRSSMLAAQIRPRFVGYQRFEIEGGALLHRLLEGDLEAGCFAHRLAELAERCCPARPG